MIILSHTEKQNLRKRKIYIKNLHTYTVDESQECMETSYERARDIHALIQFQSIPSIGIRFAEDLLSMGIFSLNDIKDCDPAELFDQYEKQRGCWIDSCVEDQFRLVVDYAKNGDSTKKW